MNVVPPHRPEGLTVTLTAAPRSSVIHIIDARPTDFSDGWSHQTRCGRRIGDEWAGEYTEAPAGPATCQRCIKGAADDQTALETSAKYRVGQRVGLLTGFQSVSGAWIWSYGTVTAVRLYWRNSGPAFHVIADGESEEYVYEAWQLSADVSRDVAPITKAARAAGIPVSDDGWPVIGHPVWKMNAAGSGVLLDAIARYAERQACMERHPAGKSLREHRQTSERAANGQERPPASVVDAFTRRGYTVRRAERATWGGPSRWVVMAYQPRGLKDNGTYRYVVGSIREGDREWTSGIYTINLMTADAAYRGKL